MKGCKKVGEIDNREIYICEKQHILKTIIEGLLEKPIERIEYRVFHAVGGKPTVAEFVIIDNRWIDKGFEIISLPEGCKLRIYKILRPEETIKETILSRELCSKIMEEANRLIDEAKEKIKGLTF